jgi:hypothetical protein
VEDRCRQSRCRDDVLPNFADRGNIQFAKRPIQLRFPWGLKGRRAPRDGVKTQSFEYAPQWAGHFFMDFKAIPKLETGFPAKLLPNKLATELQRAIPRIVGQSVLLEDPVAGRCKVQVTPEFVLDLEIEIKQHGHVGAEVLDAEGLNGKFLFRTVLCRNRGLPTVSEKQHAGTCRGKVGTKPHRPFLEEHGHTVCLTRFPVPFLGALGSGRSPFQLRSRYYWYSLGRKVPRPRVASAGREGVPGSGRLARSIGPELAG